MIELSDLEGARRRAGRRVRAGVLRVVAVALVVGAAVAVVAGALSLRGAGAGAGGWWGLAGLVACALPLALVCYAAARVDAREAGERLFLDGPVLVVANADGRHGYDLSRVPVQLGLRVFMSRTPTRPVWAYLRVGGGQGPYTVELCHPATGALRPAADLVALAHAVAGNPDPEAQRAAGRLRTLAAWGSLAPLDGARVEDIPVTPPPPA
ncbi:MAG TPA: hypothetical protein VNV66_22185 [Pilimelia sp.]|nr:hypothetical protein [Pilimelia sp.]